MCNIYISVHSKMFNQNNILKILMWYLFRFYWVKILSDFMSYFPLCYSEMTTEYVKKENCSGNLLMVGRSVVSFDLMALFGFLHFFPVRS